jgi:drug/metabolite transporter (DMT)-like permease
MQYSAIRNIPLSLSSVISFTTGPIFSGILAFVLIGENLTLVEALTIFFGICGTVLITMPELFGIDDPNLSLRLEKDLSKNHNYYVGIFKGLVSSFLDALLYFLVRKIGKQIPSGIFPFISGLITCTLVTIYCTIYEPFDLFFIFHDNLS